MSTSRIDSRKSLTGSDPVFSQSHTPAYTRSYDPIDYNHNHPADYNHNHPADYNHNHPADYNHQPVYAEPSPDLHPPPPTYPPTNMNNSKPDEGYNQGYAHRQGLAPSSPQAKSAPKRWCAFMSNKWAAMFFGVTVLQAIICLCFESYIFAKFQSQISPNLPSVLAPEVKKEIEANMKTIPTFLTLFIFGFLYEFIIVWDALRAKNTIQVIGVCFANLALVVYTAIQVDQMKWALDELFKTGQVKDVISADIVFEWLRPSLIVIPCIIGFVTILMGFITWKLYQEFAWDILKIIGADYRMKKRFLHYQIYIALLKFDFFFFLGFIIQLVVIVTDTQDVEFALTIVTIPITILILVAAAFFTRRENKWGMGGVFILYIGGLTYFIYKLARIHSTDPKWQEYYKTVRRSLTAFAAITIFFILLTMTNCIVCVLNFNKGLKQHLLSKKKKKGLESQEGNDVNLNDVKPQSSRMTID